MTVKEAIIKLMDCPMDSYLKDLDGESITIDVVPGEDDWGYPIVTLTLNGDEIVSY